MISWIFGLVPWAQIGIICGALISIITLFSLVGARWGPFRNWINNSIQDVLGIAEVKRDFLKYIEDRTTIDDVIGRGVEKTIEAQQATQVQLQDLSNTVKVLAQAQDRHHRQPDHNSPPARRRR